MKSEAKTRGYDASRRRAAADKTANRILDTAFELFLASSYDEVSLREIARKSGVALQTVVNHFGTKDQLLVAVFDRAYPEALDSRDAVQDGDIDHLIEVIIDQCEAYGDAFIGALALESRIPVLATVLDRGRRIHREWIERVFVNRFQTLSKSDRAVAVSAHLVATDVYVWKLLRRDMGLDIKETTKIFRRLLDSLDYD